MDKCAVDWNVLIVAVADLSRKIFSMRLNCAVFWILTPGVMA